MVKAGLSSHFSVVGGDGGCLFAEPTIIKIHIMSSHSASGMLDAGMNAVMMGKPVNGRPQINSTEPQPGHAMGIRPVNLTAICAIS